MLRATCPGSPMDLMFHQEARQSRLFRRSGNAHLFIDLMESDDAPRMTKDVEVSAMPGFVFVDDGTDESRKERSATIDPLAGFKDALKAAQDMASNGKIGIEKGALLGGLMAYLNSQVKEDQSVDSDDLLYEARLIKTPWEIDMLRMAAQHMRACSVARGSAA
jgi:Xaa-Pro dipeptidase